MSIHGTFYFTKTKSGNLLGEFINNGLKNFIVESANIDEGFCKEKAEGAVYRSWNELRQTKRKLCVVAPAEKTKGRTVFPVGSLCIGGYQLFQQSWSKDSGGDRNCRIR